MANRHMIQSNGKTGQQNFDENLFSIKLQVQAKESNSQNTMISNKKNGKTYVIGYGKSKLLREFLEEVRDILSPGQDMGFGERPYNADAVMHLECAISDLTADTGFVPTVDFEEGIQRLAHK